MLSALAADAVVVAHLAFVAFVAGGGLLALRWPLVAFAHVPAALWGAGVEAFGWMCPLTPLEQHLRRAAGEETYAGGFIEHYLMPVLYPEALTREIQLALAAAVVILNVAVYIWVWRRHRRLSAS